MSLNTRQYTEKKQSKPSPAARRSLQSGGIQAKLTIGQSNDMYEQEADRLADRVMRMTEGTSVDHPPQVTPGIESSTNHLQPDGDVFWIFPRGVSEDAMPIFDMQNGNVIGFEESFIGCWQIYDLYGNRIDSGEGGLESPMFSPADIIFLTRSPLILIKPGLKTAKKIGKTAGKKAKYGIRSSNIYTKNIGRLRTTYRKLRQNAVELSAKKQKYPVPYHIEKLTRHFGSIQIKNGYYLYTIKLWKNGKKITYKTRAKCVKTDKEKGIKKKLYPLPSLPKEELDKCSRGYICLLWPYLLPCPVTRYQYLAFEMTRTKPAKRDPDLAKEIREECPKKGKCVAHHVIPLFLGGEDRRSNLMPLYKDIHIRGHSCLLWQPLTKWAYPNYSNYIYSHPYGTKYRILGRVDCAGKK